MLSSGGVGGGGGGGSRVCVCVCVCVRCVCVSVGSQLPTNYRRVVLWWRRVQRSPPCSLVVVVVVVVVVSLSRIYIVSHLLAHPTTPPPFTATPVLFVSHTLPLSVRPRLRSPLSPGVFLCAVYFFTVSPIAIAQAPPSPGIFACREITSSARCRRRHTHRLHRHYLHRRFHRLHRPAGQHVVSGARAPPPKHVRTRARRRKMT